MKVVLFCGGLGLRLHPSTEKVPKPLVAVGGKPILLQLMKYYSYYGHKEFILCLGYKGGAIKEFFLNYDEYLTGDFILSNGKIKEKLFKSDIEDWKITFAETGINTPLGERLLLVKKYIEKDAMFLANYSDGITDLHLPNLIDYSEKRNKTGVFITVKPSVVFHYVSTTEDDFVTDICQLNQTTLRINGGFFVFKNDIFDYINPGEDLVNEPFQRLIEKKQLLAYKYDGFWASLDTYKDKQRLDELASKNASSWEIWKNHKTNGEQSHA